ncbi:alpha/beta hydrolase [Marinobacter salexigens]|uniref:alpha/beta hydrolase n=1 Tax=Marinobacter salexigens TaxID=1925763 RepID=UPI000C28F739|nr:alpha/beta hydrolase [Marinobacter salexigens]
MIASDQVLDLLQGSLPNRFLTIHRKSPFTADYVNGRIVVVTGSGYKTALSTNDFLKLISMVVELRVLVVSRYKKYFFNASYFLPVALYILDKVEGKNQYSFVIADEKTIIRRVSTQKKLSRHVAAMTTGIRKEIGTASLAPQLTYAEATPTIERDGTRKFTPIDVYFATNRKPLNSPEYFSSERNDSITYGRAVVTIPADRKGGKIKRPFEFFTIKMKERKDKHFTIERIDCQSEVQFFESVHSKSDGQKLLVFVHGYNVDFLGAVFKTAQIKYDFGITEEPVILFSWPSKGSVRGYAHDKESSLYSRDSLKEFLGKLSTLGYTEISVIAHSMGGFCLAEAIKAKIDGAFSFSRLVLASADIRLKDFRYNYLDSLKNNFHQVALYVSGTDTALRLSRSANMSVRVGDCSQEIAVYDGVDTVDMSYNKYQFFDLRIMAHSYFSDSDRVMDDLHGFIRNGIPANKRRLDKIDVPPLYYYRIKGVHS